MNKHLFIAGMEKCGTTALASWFVNQGLAEFLVPNIKEPYIYARTDFGSFPLGGNYKKDWLLDASVGYSRNPAAIARMPEHDCRVVLCFRNPWERTWSAYRMYKLDPKELIKNVIMGPKWKKCPFTETALMCYPAKSRPFIEKYCAAERTRLQEGDFLSRLYYERDFLHVRRTYPFFSILQASSFRLPLGNILGKFAPRDVFVVSLSRLRDATLRNRFVHDLLGMEGEYPEIPKKFVLEGRDIGEEKPDFTRPEFDGMRSAFRYDLQEFRSLIEREGIATDYLDFDALQRNIM
ncbi:MAG: hypothetical protein LBO79_06965 [Zoogloeaceae bacterium]|jgi:hypothetical protein|nr:hypothetical protein [Zoogloeaceae bacterium]